MTPGHETLHTPLGFASGGSVKNRFFLSPLTNLQSHPDGTLSEDEYRWLTKRAEGGFGLTMTCAAHVQAQGQGFPGQLGVFDDRHLDGLTRLAAAIRGHGSVAAAQLHHAGMRSPASLIGAAPLCPSDNAETGARGLQAGEVEEVIDDFVAAASRCQRAGFDGVELHGAHGYLLCQFLSPEINRRTDRWGGEIEARSSILFDIIEGVRQTCRPDFHLGVRLSPERFGLRMSEILWVAGKLLREGRIDYLDLSLWDVFKTPVEEAFQGRSLVSWFTTLERGAVRLGGAGKLLGAEKCADAIAAGLDFVVIGRGGILHHDYPRRAADPAFSPTALPVSPDYLRGEGLGEAFVDYMRTWEGFVTDGKPLRPTG